jgi:hypothetical protein
MCGHRHSGHRGRRDTPHLPGRGVPVPHIPHVPDGRGRASARPYDTTPTRARRARPPHPACPRRARTRRSASLRYNADPGAACPSPTFRMSPTGADAQKRVPTTPGPHRGEFSARNPRKCNGITIMLQYASTARNPGRPGMHSWGAVHSDSFMRCVSHLPATTLPVSGAVDVLRSAGLERNYARQYHRG